MKKLLCLALLLFLTQKIWAQEERHRVIDGQINWGPFVNCEIYNDSHRRMSVIDYQYTITYTNGFQRVFNYKCQFGCEVPSFDFQRFSGPRNHPNIMHASCLAHVFKERRHRRN
ncbi:hypothetical protein DAY19_02310 [Halobacteriovorax vibrionivorans]|uniref:Uncharacterized protein n=1 Tax=Halobacteriovorax vibrionivorans TaxID=2152716 RepID=A0ABY0IN21_9BACT|nr:MULTISPECIES: hypothetical protein [Halobacteriovorax]RZF22627.1 hypothetical protein DAY19_02310 [Halobacteriovorax vibrionivorans]TGD47847.1 hypothetical protein EP118_06405 [Halobacteriovorax sp. Y22]